MSDVKRATRLTMLHRNARRSQPFVAPRKTLMPRSMFEGLGLDDLLEAYDAMDNLNAEIVRQDEEARRCRAEADVAEQRYAQDSRTAMASGVDPATVINRAPELRAEADRHEQMAQEAKAAAKATGYRLGALIQEAVPVLLPAIEQRMVDAAAQMRKVLEKLQEHGAAWGSAWHVRTALGYLALYGGQLPSYKGEFSGLSIAVGAAREIDEQLAKLDTLKAEEEIVRQWQGHA